MWAELKRKPKRPSKPKAPAKPRKAAWDRSSRSSTVYNQREAADNRLPLFRNSVIVSLGRLRRRFSKLPDCPITKLPNGVFHAYPLGQIHRKSAGSSPARER